MTKPFVSVVIPCYNEGKNLARGVLEEVNSYFKKQKYGWEVIISDDRSTDDSVAMVEKYCRIHPQFRLLKNAHAGKPFALKAGLDKSLGEIVLFTDMDQSTPIDQLDKLLPYCDRYELVIGSRGQSRTGFSLFRQVASSIFRLFRRALILPEIVDTQCGFKAFKRSAIERVFERMAMFKTNIKAVGWRVSAYDVEALFVAQKLGYRIKEVPVIWQDEDVSVGKKRNFIKESKDMLLEVLRVRINDLKGVYV